MSAFSRYNRVAGAAAVLTAFTGIDYRVATREALEFAQQRARHTGQEVAVALDANDLERRNGRTLAVAGSVAAFVAALLAVRFEAPDAVVLAFAVTPSLLLMLANLIEGPLRRRLP